MDQRTRVTRAFLFTDLESSTRRWQSEIDTMGAALEVHDHCLEESIRRVGGTVVKHTGDGVLAVFDEAGAALAAAVAGQHALADADWGASAPLRARMAVDAGVAEQRGGDYFGTTLNRAARLLGVAHARQVLCSGAAAESAADTLPDGVELVDLGEHRLRDLERAVQVFQVMAPGIPTEFPPLRSLSAARHNLPVIPNTFVGRDAAIESLGAAVDEHPLVTLTGVGGAGKTRLALEFAARRVDTFADGAFLVDLSTVSTDAAVVGACADTLELPAAPGGRSERDQVLAALQGRSMLLLLDNCEHVVDGAAGLAVDIVTSSPEVRVVATSREPLGVAGEQIQPVRPLAADGGAGDAGGGPGAWAPAVELFTDRAAAVRPDFSVGEDEWADVRRICERLDGLPLAIELAAARVSHLSVGQIADRLDDRFRLLRGGGRRADRHATLRAAISWSHDLLDDEQRRLLRRLAVFAGPFTLEAVEGVCFEDNDERLDAVDLVGSLVDRSLVVTEFAATPPRYRLLETVRAFAEEELVAAGEAGPFRDRHATWFADTVEPHIGVLLGPEEWNRLRPVYENIRAAVAWSLDSGQMVLATRLLAGFPVVDFTAGVLSERQALLRQVLDSPATADHSELRAACWSELATILVMLADPNVVEVLQLATDTEELPDGIPLAIVWAWRALAESTLAVTAPEFVERSVASADRALEIVDRRDVGDSQTAWVHAVVALAYLDLGRFEVVAGLSSRAVEDTAELIGQVTSPAPAILSVYWSRLAGSVAAFMTGDVTSAYELVRPLFDAVRTNGTLGSALAVLAAAHGESTEALTLLRASVEGAKRVAFPLVTAECLIGYGAVAAIDEEWETAARLLAAATASSNNPDVAFAFRSPAIAVLYHHFRDRVRSSLSPERARELRNEGRGMSHDEALALADPEAWARPGDA